MTHPAVTKFHRASLVQSSLLVLFLLLANAGVSLIVGMLVGLAFSLAVAGSVFQLIKNDAMGIPMKDFAQTTAQRGRQIAVGLAIWSVMSVPAFLAGEAGREALLSNIICLIIAMVWMSTTDVVRWTKDRLTQEKKRLNEVRDAPEVARSWSVSMVLFAPFAFISLIYVTLEGTFSPFDLIAICAVAAAALGAVVFLIGTVLNRGFNKIKSRLTENYSH